MTSFALNQPNCTLTQLQYLKPSSVICSTFDVFDVQLGRCIGSLEMSSHSLNVFKKLIHDFCTYSCVTICCAIKHSNPNKTPQRNILAAMGFEPTPSN
ncbi:unnamed protein product [Clavelina lepadiformis]|uniref:Uncharacterized protein n=1 Tax=Clavelina lepadiformis TaxID=159417 RepID=A0ABP0GGY3_CLALP